MNYFRYVQLPSDEIDTQLLQDATRKEAAQGKQWSLPTNSTHISSLSEPNIVIYRYFSNVKWYQQSKAS